MKIKDYMRATARTESQPPKEELERRFSQYSRVIHMIMGLCTESGELLDPIKRHLYYGKPLDLVLVEEEMGDAFYYLFRLCDILDIDPEKVMDQNIAKLKARYQKKFTEEGALNRDLTKEREVLEALSQFEDKDE